MTQRAIVTGAGTGIGRAAAIELSMRGCELILAGRRIDKLHEVAEECAGNGSVALPHAADISTAEGCDSVIQAARDLPGGIEPVLVNCAGAAAFGPLHEMSQESIEVQINTNLAAPIELTRAILPWMLESGGGRIVNVASMAATRVLPGSAVYSATKAGLLQFGRVVLQEYRDRGVLVTTVLCGAVDTPLWDDLEFSPNRNDMIPVDMIGKVIAQVVTAQRNMVVEELTVMPLKGVL
ncbi:MAG: SDR family NAD(P)-dependent oxidoreductase [Fimbriimonadaceae bacterium]|nr:SDR family NAD(P)-dependent oxidoreductase [Fimbriimonadaceae bacterium]